MKKFSKGFTIVELLVVIAIIGILAFVILKSIGKAEASCWFCAEPDPTTESAKAASVQKGLITAVPIPQITNSLERANVSKRAQIFNIPDKISYVYLVSFGKVMAFYTAKGKISSLQSYMVPTEKLVNYSGNPCSRGTLTGECNVVAAPDIDGTYGENVEGIFFFTTEGAYVEWKGEYMVSDQPLKLSTPAALIREIK